MSMRRAGAEFRDDVGEETRALLGGGDGPRLWRMGNDVVCRIRLGQADDVELVVVLLEMGGEVGGRGVRIVAADGVEDVDAVLRELLGRDVEGELALLDEAALHGVLDVGELDAAVADDAAAVLFQDAGRGADSRV